MKKYVIPLAFILISLILAPTYSAQMPGNNPGRNPMENTSEKAESQNNSNPMENTSEKAESQNNSFDIKDAEEKVVNTVTQASNFIASTVSAVIRGKEKEKQFNLENMNTELNKKQGKLKVHLAANNISEDSKVNLKISGLQGNKKGKEKSITLTKEQKEDTATFKVPAGNHGRILVTSLINGKKQSQKIVRNANIHEEISMDLEKEKLDEDTYRIMAEFDNIGERKKGVIKLSGFNIKRNSNKMVDNVKKFEISEDDNRVIMDRSFFSGEQEGKVQVTIYNSPFRAMKDVTLKPETPIEYNVKTEKINNEKLRTNIELKDINQHKYTVNTFINTEKPVNKRYKVNQSTTVSLEYPIKSVNSKKLTMIVKDENSNRVINDVVEIPVTEYINPDKLSQKETHKVIYHVSSNKNKFKVTTKLLLYNEQYRNDVYIYLDNKSKRLQFDSENNNGVLINETVLSKEYSAGTHNPSLTVKVGNTVKEYDLNEFTAVSPSPDNGSNETDDGNQTVPIEENNSSSQYVIGEIINSSSINYVINNDTTTPGRFSDGDNKDEVLEVKNRLGNINLEGNVTHFGNIRSNKNLPGIIGTDNDKFKVGFMGSNVAPGKIMKLELDYIVGDNVENKSTSVKIDVVTPNGQDIDTNDPSDRILKETTDYEFSNLQPETLNKSTTSTYSKTINLTKKERKYISSTNEFYIIIESNNGAEMAIYDMYIRSKTPSSEKK